LRLVRWTYSRGSHKRVNAIENPHHYTLKLSGKDKAKLKVLAAKRGKTVMFLLAMALERFFKNPPSEISRIPPPPKSERIVFIVEQQIKDALQSFAALHNVPAQTIITAAMNTHIWGNPAEGDDD